MTLWLMTYPIIKLLLQCCHARQCMPVMHSWQCPSCRITKAQDWRWLCFLGLDSWANCDQANMIAFCIRKRIATVQREDGSGCFHAGGIPYKCRSFALGGVPVPCLHEHCELAMDVHPGQQAQPHNAIDDMRICGQQ